LTVFKKLILILKQTNTSLTSQWWWRLWLELSVLTPLCSLIVSPDEVGDTLVLGPSAAAAAGNCLVSGGYRPQFWRDCFSIWYTFGGLRSRHPSKMVRVGSFPWGWGPKNTQIKHFFIFFIVWLKNILPHTFILFWYV
jgi:hypothetical protein